jgi:acyl carrier protein
MREKAEVAVLVRQKLGIALGRQIGEDENIRQTDEPLWDSVKHLEFMLMLEETFGIVLEPDDFALMTDVESCTARVIALVESHTSAGR